ncbi:MAG TPA: quinone oxidoreductase [Gemmatimonadaceae bacterium]|nr:quinone oxidoreductase [Gemmatimonadaceae bacterium]
MTGAIRISTTGGPEVLRWETIELGAPGPGQVRLAHTAIGINYIDVYHRSGLYPQPLPFIPGVEGVGVVETIGPGVHGLEPGVRVAYALLPGSYAEARLAPADRLIPLPDHVDDDVAAGLMLRGMTVEFLVERCYHVVPGEWVLWQAAAGGTGTIAMGWLKALGATVIGTAGSDEKCAAAAALGADFVINYRTTDWVTRVKDLTGGRGVDVVYDGVGRDTCVPSLDCLKPTGSLITFGNASGAVPPIEPLTLMKKGSLHVTRPSLAHYIASRADLEQSAASVFDMLARRAIRPTIGGRYALADAATAHRDLEARRTHGSIVFTL